MKTKLNVAGFAPLVCVLLMALVFTACTGTYTDPDLGGSSKSAGGGVKPAKLLSSATASEASAKLDEIIAYSGTPGTVVTSAQTMKTGWSGYSSNWSFYATTVIMQINLLIDSIP
jgi:hypothetical protein